MVAFGITVCPRRGVAFESDKRHIWRDALTKPTAELWREEVLERFFWRGESPEVGGGVSTCGVV